MQIDRANIKNILVVRNDRFGEFLLNIPALRALKETFINTRIIAVVNSYVKELVECMPFVDEIIEWGREKHALSRKLKLIGNLRKKNINIAIMLNPSPEFNIFTYLAGIPIRVGYDRKWGFLLTHKIEDKKYLGEKHEVEYNLELVDLIQAKTEDKTLSLKIDSSITDNFGVKDNANLVAVHPWTSDAVKQWPIDNFRKLSERLIKEKNLKIAIIGGKEELNKNKELFSDSNLINMTGKTTLKQLASLLKKSRLLISGDSGPVHLACAVGTPVIVIFRNDIPGKSAKRWGPWGPGNFIIEKDNLCDITVDEVFSKAKEALNR